MQFIAYVFLISLSLASMAETLKIPIGEFSLGKLGEWETKVLKGETLYQLIPLDGRTVLRAESHGTASGLIRRLTVDLEKTPYLNWSWCVENTLGELDERSKAGDDYPARLYAIVSGGLAFWRTLSLNYVWASAMPKGSHWPNAFAGGNVQMLAQQSGAAELGRWHQEKRNIRNDLKIYFGEDIRNIDAIALMTDTDNIHGNAVAYYGDIYFSSQ